MARTAATTRIVIPRSAPLELLGFDEAATGNVTGRGGTVFTDSGTMVVAVGKHGRGRSNTAGARFYQLLDSDPTCDKFSTGGAFAVACWVNHVSIAAEQGLVGKYTVTGSGVGSLREWNLFKKSGADYAFNGSTLGTSATTAQAVSGVTPSTGIWYFVAGWFDPSDGTVNCQVNMGTVGSTALAGSQNGGLFSGTENLYIGAYNGGATSRLNGTIDTLMWFNYVPSQAEWAYWYGGGFGAETYTLP